MKVYSMLLIIVIVLIVKVFPQVQFSFHEQESKPSIKMSEDSVIVKLTLLSVTDTIVSNQNFVPNNAFGHWWGIYIDSDGDSSTGNLDGFDVSLSLSAHCCIRTILDGTQKNTWILNESGGTYGHTIDAYIDETNQTLIMKGSRNWNELINVDESDRFYFQTFYWSKQGPVVDYTEENNFTNVVYDSLGDVSFSFIDIIKGSLNVGELTDINTKEFGEIPSQITLSQNYPNPFNPSTTIQYAINSKQFVTLKIFDVLGKEVATLVNEEKQAGSYEIEFEGSEFTSGIYFYKIQAGDFVETRKMILVR